MVECKDRSLYVGVAKDPALRLRQHNWGIGALHTRRRRPVKLVWWEEHSDEGGARLS
ncbi:MAG: GIY-YIG nuclease family protein [Candidatus Acidiferrales bacterium]